MKHHEIIIQPDGIVLVVEHGTLVSDALKTAGIDIQMPCGGKGICGKCTVEIHPNPPQPNVFDRKHLSKKELNRGIRLACQTKIDRNMKVLISPGLRILDGVILVDGIKRKFSLDPVVKKTYLELSQSTLENPLPDFTNVTQAMGVGEKSFSNSLSISTSDIELLRELPGLLRNAEYKITVVTSQNRIIDVQPGDTSGKLYGMAFDIGTTTVVGTLIHLPTGRELSYSSQLNSQVVYGGDTISRIQHVIEHHSGGRDMAEKIRGVVNGIINECLEIAEVDRSDIFEICCAGNTTMSHLFLELDPSGLSQIPFVPATNKAVYLRASEIGIEINSRGTIYMLPSIAGFVGSDTVAVMLACDYLSAASQRDEEPDPVQLAVDVGTNGELALRHKGSLTVCSTAAGPALEGATLSCGMCAAQGAIEHVSITAESLEYDVIGNMEPTGICGSGIIDLVAELLDAGIIDQTGAFASGDELKMRLSGDMFARIVTLDEQPAFLLFSPAEKDSVSRNIVITQRDIRQVQLAKGAIRAGINLVLEKSGLTPDDLDEILLAGAFGNYIKKSSARRIGLLPDIPEERIRFIGNAASTGVKMVLLSHSVRSDADRIKQTAKHIELAALPEFMNEFADTMIFQ